MRRRSFLSAMLLLAASAAVAKVKVIYGGMPWVKGAASLPKPVDATSGWQFFDADEARAVEAIADRLIPADELSIGGKEAGCAVFIDRQLSGDYGRAATQYRLGPFLEGTPQQGPQFRDTPAERYRKGLAALNAYCRGATGQPFAALSTPQQDAILTKLDTGTVDLGVVDSRAFFDLLLQNVREGYFADPIYGGNKDMAGWKLLGFPGAQYDFRDAIGRRGEDLKIIPISLIGGDRA
jgi:gluconate 2-dehydrogenase gamma chain